MGSSFIVGAHCWIDRAAGRGVPDPIDEGVEGPGGEASPLQLHFHLWEQRKHIDQAGPAGRGVPDPIDEASPLQMSANGKNKSWPEGQLLARTPSRTGA